MKNTTAFTVTGNLWHYHLIGVGMIFTYSERAKQVYFISESSGTIIQTVDMNSIGGYQSQEDFIRDSKNTFMSLIEKEKLNLNHQLMDNPTIIDTPLGGVGVDFSIMNN